MLRRSATSESSSLRYSFGSGSGHTGSPTASAAAWTCSFQPSRLPMRPAILSPSATMHAPVNVATSTTASGLSSAARASASARMRRPSASVLSTSTVLPFRILRTSPGRMAVPLGMFSTIGTYAVTLALTPSSFSTDIAASTAAAPDMSVFIVSMPLDVFSDRPPESKTTPLPTNATEPFLPCGEYVALTRRGGLPEPWPTPTTPPSPSALSSASLITFTVTPLPRRSFLAASANAAGDLAPDGSFTMSRAQVTAAATVAPRSSAASTRAFARPTTTTFERRVASPSPLYLRNWYEPSANPSASACAATGRSIPAASARSTSVVATDAAFVALRATAAAARRTPSALTSSNAPTPTSIAAAERRRPRVGTASVWPALPSKSASVMNAARSASTRSTGEAERVNVSDTSASCGCSVPIVGADGAKAVLLPACQRVDEVGESVQVRDDLAVVEPAGVAGGDRLALGATDDGASKVEGGRELVLTREHELLRRMEAGRDIVDDRFEGGDHLGRHARDAGLEPLALAGVGRELGPGDEQLALQSEQQRVELRPGFREGPGETERGDGLVDVAVRRGTGRVLLDSPAVEQPGGAVVTGTRVHLPRRRSHQTSSPSQARALRRRSAKPPPPRRRSVEDAYKYAGGRCPSPPSGRHRRPEPWRRRPVAGLQSPAASCARRGRSSG